MATNVDKETNFCYDDRMEGKLEVPMVHEQAHIKKKLLDMIMVLTRRTFPGEDNPVDEAALKGALISNEEYFMPGESLVESISELIKIGAGYYDLEEMIELEKGYREKWDTHENGPEQAFLETVRRIRSESPEIPHDIILAFAMDKAREAHQSA